MRVSFNFEKTVLELIKKYINYFIVDNLLNFGEEFLGCKTPILFDGYKKRVQRLNVFSKWILRDVSRYSLDTESNNYEFLYQLFIYIWNYETPETHNLPFLTTLRLVVCYAMDSEKDDSGKIYIIKEINDEINSLND